MGQPTAVALLFDKVNRVIGVNPASPSMPNAFPVKTKTNGRDCLIRATPFCKHYGITVDTTAFLNPAIDADGVLRLDLKTTTPAVDAGGIEDNNSAACHYWVLITYP